MRKSVFKFFGVWDYEKEERWLNEMAAKGLTLVSMSFCKYIFEETNPSEYTIRLQLLPNSPKSIEGESYIRFVEETGATYLSSFKKWVYFKKAKAEGEFNLISDRSAIISQLSRIRNLLTVLIAALLAVILAIVFHFKFTFPLGEIIFLAVSYGSMISLLTFNLIRVMLKIEKVRKERSLFES